jgi:hypothetical protein
MGITRTKKLIILLITAVVLGVLIFVFQRQAAAQPVAAFGRY